MKTQKSIEEKIDNIKILIDHLSGLSYRNLESRYRFKKKKLCQIVNKLTNNLKSNFEVSQYFLKQLKYSGNLVIDGKYIPVKEIVEADKKIVGKIPRSKKRQKVKKGKVLIWGADYTSHDIPNHEFDVSENGYVFDEYFKKLKLINYPLVSITVDDKHEIVWAAKRNFSDCVIQLCIRHYMAKISKMLAIGNIKIKINSLEKKIDKLFIYSEKDIYDQTNDYIPDTQNFSITQIVGLSNEITVLEFKYELLLDFQNIIFSIINASNYQIALYRINYLEKYFLPKRFAMRNQFPAEQIRTIKKLFKDFNEHQEYLLNYLKYPHLNIPSTTNLMEGYNSQLESRINSIKGFESIQTAENYINAWITKRRFTKFTDCRKCFKKLNGKTPLGCAGADISNVSNWVEWLLK